MMETNLVAPWPSRAKRDEELRNRGTSVLLTAVQLFNEKGFNATSLDDVAARLNITKPIIYRHFSNKDQILFECVRMGLDQVREATAAVAGSPGTGLDRLAALLHRYAEIMTMDFGICVIRTRDHELRPESRSRFRKLKTEIDATICEIIEEGIADGSIDARNVRLTAFAATCTLDGIARWNDPAGPNSPEEIADFFVNFILRGIAPRLSSWTA